MATITELTFDLLPGSSIDTLTVKVTTVLRFNEFDRNTNINYKRTYTLVGGGGSVQFPVPTSRVVIGGPIEIDPDTVLATFHPTHDDPVDASHPDVVDSVLELVDEFEIDRATADEDPGPAEDELSVHCELDPALPSTSTFVSNEVVAALP